MTDLTLSASLAGDLSDIRLGPKGYFDFRDADEALGATDFSFSVGGKLLGDTAQITIETTTVHYYDFAPWIVHTAGLETAQTPEQAYSAWATELNVSDVGSSYDFSVFKDADDGVHVITLPSSILPGHSSKLGIASEAALFFYADDPNSTRYAWCRLEGCISYSEIGRFYVTTSRPSMCISFRPDSSDLDAELYTRHAKSRASGETFIFYGRWAHYSDEDDKVVRVAVRIEPGKVQIVTRPETHTLDSYVWEMEGGSEADTTYHCLTAIKDQPIDSNYITTTLIRTSGIPIEDASEVKHTASYSLLMEKSHALRYAIFTGASHSTRYAIPLQPAIHALAYSDVAAVSTTHRAVYADAQAARSKHRAVYGDTATPATTHRLAYGDTQSVQAAHRLAYDRASMPHTTHRAVYADAKAARAQHRAVYGDSSRASQGHRLRYADRPVLASTRDDHYHLLASTDSTHAARYTLTERDQPNAQHRARYSVASASTLISIDATPALYWQGQQIRVIDCQISADEGSPVWMAERIEIADLAPWQRLSIGDDIALHFGSAIFNLRIDGLGYRDEHGDARYEISALSPLAWRGSPHAAPIDLDNESTHVSARETVTALLDPISVDWRITDWTIPRKTLAITNTTPLDAARQIAAAIGALIESEPDGTAVVRQRHPVSTNQYASATVDANIESHQVFSTQVTADPYDGFNCVTVANEEINDASGADRIEYQQDDDSIYHGNVRAWPEPARAVELGHTGHPNTSIDSNGERFETYHELIEFIAGEGKTRYPIHAVDDVNWQHVNLGDVIADGVSLTSAINGESLAWVTYRTRFIDWRVGLDRDEAVQFVLI
jgi:hypothetical protein